MLFGKNLHYMWGKSIDTKVYILNRKNKTENIVMQIRKENINGAGIISIVSERLVVRKIHPSGV